MLLTSLFFTVFAHGPDDDTHLEVARAAARQSIADGERRQLTSKYWQTFTTPAFTTVVPSYAEATESNSTGTHVWTLDLAGPYMLSVVMPADPDANTAVKARLSGFPGGKVVPTDTPQGRVFKVSGATHDAWLGVRQVSQSRVMLVELSAPAGELDSTVATRVWEGFTPR